jgi:hypothetical protein
LIKRLNDMSKFLKEVDLKNPLNPNSDFIKTILGVNFDWATQKYVPMKYLMDEKAKLSEYYEK